MSRDRVYFLLNGVKRLRSNFCNTLDIIGSNVMSGIISYHLDLSRIIVIALWPTVIDNDCITLWQFQNFDVG